MKPTKKKPARKTKQTPLWDIVATWRMDKEKPFTKQEAIDFARRFELATCEAIRLWEAVYVTKFPGISVDTGEDLEEAEVSFIKAEVRRAR